MVYEGDGKSTFVYGIADERDRLIETQNVRAEDADQALRLLRAGGFLEGDNGEAYRALLMTTKASN